MLLNRTSFDAATKAFRALYKEALASTQVDYPIVANRVNAPGVASIDWSHMGSTPKMAKFTGESNFDQLRAQHYLVYHEEYQTGFEVARKDFERDQLGVYNPKAQELGSNAALHFDELVFGLFSDGFSTKGYDGQNFFSATHKDHPKQIVQSNTTNVALSGPNYMAARAKMAKFRDDKDRIIRVRPSLLVVPPALEGTALDILEAEYLANGASNTARGTAKHLVCPYLETDTEWYVLDTTRAIKPFLLQVELAPEFSAQDGPASDAYFEKNRIRYKIYGRYAAGYSMWQFALGSTGDA